MMHRSEFDQLTETHTRFSFERRLDTLIQDSHLRADIFGLIYLDLDRFKQVNDHYGHQTGDLYLQEMTMRMKRQLRSVDTLARLGGDEFAVLVPNVRNRSVVADVAHRLERCFDEPFSVGDVVVLRGSASVGIALYPEDGTTRDSLLTVADTTMYVVKHTRSP
jgi:diguanylate cyclase (GGDEF)-like protein